MLSEALEQLNSSISILYLSEGTHVLTQYTPIFSLQGIFILGSKSSEVIVMCDHGIGLSFMNIDGLTMCGFTVDGCGLTGDPIERLKQQLKTVVKLWFGIPSIVKYGMVLGHCSNVTLTDLHITNTSGMGLLGINVLGDFTFHRMRFTHNIRQSCRIDPARFPFNASDSNILKQIGGGAYFLYQDEVSAQQDGNIPAYNLVITDSIFSHNAECSYAAYTQVNFQKYPTFSKDAYQIGSGGGLSVAITQRNFSIHTTVENSTFRENDARFGAGAHISIFAGCNTFNVTFCGCMFMRNGVMTPDRMGTVESVSLGGSGLAVFTDLLSPNQVNEPVPFPRNNITVTVEITNTDFVSNVAGVEGGGLLVYSLFTTPHHVLDFTQGGFFTTHIDIENCLFLNNSAQYGVAAFFQQNVHEGSAGSVQLTFSEVTVSKNKLARMDVSLSTSRFLQEVSGQKIASAVALLNIYMVLKGTVTFSDNDITGVLIQSTPVLVSEGTSVLMERNRGQQGGGIHITEEGSGIGFELNTAMTFLNNTASIYGGALYVSPTINSNDVLRPVDLFTGCFILTDCFLEECFGSPLENVTIRFTGNFAPIGSIVYGTTLETCTWSRQFNSTEESIFEQLDSIDREVHFDMRPNSSSVVSTPPARVYVQGPGNVASDNNTTLQIFPGQGVNLSIEVFDQFGYSIPGTITSHVIESSRKYANSSLGGSGFFFTGNNEDTTAVLTITGDEDHSFLVFFTELGTLVSANLTIQTLPCLQGFTFDGQRCMCSERLVDRGVMCDLSNTWLISPDGVWVGNLTANASTEELVVDFCYLGFCNDGPKFFLPPWYDKQCRTGSHRTGVRCGRCMQNYSVILGSRECRKCTNTSLLLIPLFGLLGIALFVAIAFLEVTVEKGWMYSILFFSNVVTLSSLSQSLPAKWNIIYVPAHLLSFELGIGMCLYDGMETIDRVMIKLMFPLYLFILMFIFSILSRKFTFSRNFSPAKMLVTLGVMSYTSILDTCVEIVTANNLKAIDGTRHLRWLADPNVRYFEGFHCFLVLLAVVIFITYLIPVPLIFLWPQIAFKIFRKLSPLLDAMWAPFKPKYRWWLGARLVLRSVLFFCNGFLPEIGNFTSGLILLVTIQIQFILQPFNTESVNIFDNIIIGDIIALVMGVFFFANDKDNLVGPIYIATIIFVGYALIIGLLVLHFCRIWELKSKIEKFYLYMKKTQSDKKICINEDTSMASFSTAGTTEQNTAAAPTPSPLIGNARHSSFAVSERIEPLCQNLPVPADYSHLRESLLEST